MGCDKNGEFRVNSGATSAVPAKRLPSNWLRGLDLNQRPSGYEPDELPGCSTPRFRRRKMADEQRGRKLFSSPPILVCLEFRAAACGTAKTT